MSRTIGNVMPVRPEASPANQVLVYPMSAYTLGLRKPGHFHLISFKERAQESLNPLVPHSHDFYELIWFRSGTGQVHSDLRACPVRPGTLFFASPGQVHYWKFNEPLDGEIISFTHEFFLVNAENPGLFGRLPFLHAETFDPVLHFDPAEMERMNGLFRELRTAAADGAPGRDDMVRAYLTIMLTHTRRVWMRTHDGHAEPNAGTGDLLACRFRLALEENFPQMLTVSEYASLLRVSRSHLNEELRRQSGSSASKIIHERILLEAKRLLVHTSLTISEIAYRLRFQDPSYFGRFFRKCTGQTPGMYREAAHHDLLAS
jgi:AraC-like DNA-binding protein/mannose-6-phosphate isomerase-like protein (cupin superfamily)